MRSSTRASELRVQRVQCVFGPAALGDVGADDEDAGDIACARHDRLIDEVDVRSSTGPPERAAPKISRRLAIGLAARETPVEQLDVALLHRFRQRLGDRPAEYGRSPTSCR